MENSFTKLLDMVKSMYKIDSLELVTQLSENPWIYKLFDATKYYFLKVNREVLKINDGLEFHHLVIDKLKQTKIQTAKLYKTIEDKYYFVFDKKVVELYEWLEFDSYEDNDSCFETTIELMIQMLQFFETSFPINQEEQERKNQLAYLNNENFDIQRTDYLLNRFLTEEKPIIDEANYYLDRCSDECLEEIKNSSFSYIHADYNLKNIGYREQKACVLMDFERVKLGYAVEDIALCFFELCIKHREVNEIGKYSKQFFTYLNEQKDYNLSEKSLLFVICKRMIRHLNRGVELLEKGGTLYQGYYDIFLNGLKKTFIYLKSCYPIELREILPEDEKLFHFLITITKDELEPIEVEQLKEYVSDEQAFRILFDLCCKHKIMSNLYTHLIQTNLLNSVKKYYVILMNTSIAHSVEKEHYFNQEFAFINDCLMQHNISYACVKGISVSNRYYKNHPYILRDFNDMDFLVDNTDIAEVEKLLADLGYVRGFYDFETGAFTPADRGDIIYYRLASHQVYPFTKPMPNFKFSSVNVFKLDVNFSVFFGGKIKDEVSTTELLKDREYVSLEDGGQFPILSPESEIIQYCYSFYKDTIYTFKKESLAYVLSNLRDIYYILEQRNLNCEKLYDMLKDTSVKTNIYNVISYVAFCYGGTVANQILRDQNIEITQEKKQEIMRCVLKL